MREMWTLIQNLTPIEWTVVLVTTAVCLLGAVLPMLGNLLGRLFLGEDPLLARWRTARQAKHALAVQNRQLRREQKKARKAAKAANLPTNS